MTNKNEMHAILFDNNSKQLTFKENQPAPKIEHGNDVLIKVAYSGVCGTDLHICEGQFMVQEKFPVILGHEFSGEVVDVGKDVTTIKVGDKVVVDPNRGCGVCKHCQTGHPNYCGAGYEANTIGIYKHGGWANYCVSPAEQVIKIPPTVQLEQAALAEPLSCISHAYDLIEPLGDRILIQGCGIIGILWMCVLHSKGFRKVTVTEACESRLRIAEKLNLGYKVLPPDRFKCEIDSGCEPFDAVIDCSGNVPAIELGLTLIQRGGKFCMFGVSPPGETVSMKPYEIFSKEIRIYGIRVNPYSVPKAVDLIESLGKRYLTLENLGIRLYELQNYNCAFEELKRKTISKVMFKLI